MQAIQRNKLAVLMSFHLLWGSVLWFSISKLGLGLSTDSVHLLFAGENLAAGRGLVSFDGSPVAVVWPPLYPMLLGSLHALTGMSTFAAAHVLQAAAFIGLAACLCLLFNRIFPENFLMALAGNILSDIGVVVVIAFGTVGSDYVELLLVMLAILLARYYAERGSRRTYVALCAVSMLAMLDRYLGIAAIALAVVAVSVMRKADLKQRVLRGAFMSLAAVPAGVWLVLTAAIVTRRGPVPFTQNLEAFSQAVLEWFLPAEWVEGHAALAIALLWVVIAGLIVMVVRDRQRLSAAAAGPVLLFGFFYLVALFGTAAIAYYNRLEGRFLLPLYIPFVTLLLSGIDAVLRKTRERPEGLQRGGEIGAAGVVAIAIFMLLSTSIPTIRQSHAGAPEQGENAFNTMEWRQNAAIEYWQSHRPSGNYLLISNVPDAAAFYAQHACEPSPKRFAGPYATEEYPIESYTAHLFGSGQDVYLIWIDTPGRSYYYRAKDLRAIAEVEELFSGPGGAVYQLHPRATR